MWSAMPHACLTCPPAHNRSGAGRLLTWYDVVCGMWSVADVVCGMCRLLTRYVSALGIGVYQLAKYGGMAYAHALAESKPHGSLKRMLKEKDAAGSKSLECAAEPRVSLSSHGYMHGCMHRSACLLIVGISLFSLFCLYLYHPPPLCRPSRLLPPA